MKLRHLLLAVLAAGAALLSSCAPEEVLINKLEGIKLGSTYITIAKGESTASTTMSIKEAWEAESPAWLTVSPASGKAGDYTLTFTALADTLSKGSVFIKFGGKSQQITVVRDGDKAKKAGVIFEEPFVNSGQGEFETKDIVGSPWIYDAAYGMKATAYINNANTDAESYLISPEIDLTEETIANLTFEQAVNYMNGQNMADYLSVEVTVDNGANWTVVTVPNWPVGSSWDFLASGDVDLSAFLGKKIKFAFHYKSTTAASPTWEVKNVKIANVAGAVPPELTLDPESVKIAAKDELTATITATTNGTLTVTGPFSDAKCEGEIMENPWLSFEENEGVVTVTALANEGEGRTAYLLFTSVNEYGSTPAIATVSQAAGLSAYPLPYNCTFYDNDGGWTVNDVIPTPEKTVWVFDTGNYHNGWVASGNKVVAQSELVSPRIDLQTATSPVLTFDHVQRYAGNVYEELTLMVSVDEGANWTELQIPAYSDGSNWTFVSSGKISLARFVGNLAIIKFVYKTNEGHNAKWEIKNLKVEEPEAALAPANIAELNNMATATEATWSGTFTDAVVSYINGGNAFIQDATGGIQLFKNDHGLTPGKTINGAVSGKIKLYNGYAELTALDLSAATVTDGEAPAAKVLTIDELKAAYLHWQNQMVKLEGVTLDKAIDKSNNRKATAKKGEAEIAVYAQTKTISMPADTEGDLTCWPTRYNTTLQVGVFEDANFVATPSGPAMAIDGDMSDWAALADDKVAVVNGEESYDYMALKVTYDANNLYFYSKRNLARQGEWPFYIWYKIDINGAGTYAKAFYFYPYVKNNEELSIDPSPASSEISGLTLSCAAYAVDSTVEIEVSVPRSELGIENGMAIAVQSVMNKVNTGSTLTSPSLTIAD